MSIHLVELEDHGRCQAGKLRTLAFVGEQIVDVTVLEDMLFVLTSVSTEIMWRRSVKSLTIVYSILRMMIDHGNAEIWILTIFTGGSARFASI
jgi:hypothetical protein